MPHNGSAILDAGATPRCLGIDGGVIRSTHDGAGACGADGGGGAGSGSRLRNLRGRTGPPCGRQSTEQQPDQFRLAMRVGLVEHML
jgi:hypothetical protein